MKNDEAWDDNIENRCVNVRSDDDGDGDEGGIDSDGGADADDPLCLAHLACGLATPYFLSSFFFSFVGRFSCVWFAKNAMDTFRTSL